MLAVVMLIMTSGCNNSIQVGHSGTQTDSSQNPISLQPDGAKSSVGLPADQLPPPINLTDPNTIARMTVIPTIIDTNSLPVREQITGPFRGQVRNIKHQLPKHGRDKTMADGDTSRMLPVGSTIQMERIQAGATDGFPSIPQTEWSPPDPTLAVGPTHIVETVNSAIAFFDKDGNQTFSAPLGTPGNPGFFETVGASSNFVFDPKCFYDHKSERFVVMALEQIGETESWIDIAISDDSDPNGIWYKYRTFSVIALGSSNYWVDYPGFGFDDNAFYVTGNLFLLNGDGNGFGGALFRVFDKGPMLDGDPVVILDVAPDSGASLQAAQMFGDAPNCYFVSQANSTTLKLWTLEDPLTNPTINSRLIGGLNPAFSPSLNAPNLNGGEISTLDGRFMNVHYRDGKLYAAQGIDSPSGETVARWYRMDTNGWPNSGMNPALIEQGEVAGDPGQHHFFPAIYSDKFDNVGLVSARSSASEFASIQVSARMPSDPLGTMSDPIELAIGDAGADGRWGDYFDIAIDPVDDSTFWVIGMYQKNFGWQTWIGSFTIGDGCPADFTGDGTLDFFDVSAFLTAFNNADAIADLNNDGVFDFFDVSQYLSLYSQGCP